MPGEVVSNDLMAAGKSLLVINGGNQGGKSSFIDQPAAAASAGL